MIIATHSQSFTFVEKKITTLAQTGVTVNYLFNGDIEIICQLSHKKNIAYCFNFSKDYLLKFNYPFHSFFNSLETSKNYDKKSITVCKIEPILEGIITTHLTGTFKQMFLESQAILVLMYAHLECNETDNSPCYACKFLNNPNEKQKILQARVLLLIHIAEPPSIPQLARMVHINECYLKKGFKEMFGTSVFDFLQQERIKKAKNLLQQNEININHIAIELGYSNTSNFTNAFKKFTGYAPSEYRTLAN